MRRASRSLAPVWALLLALLQPFAPVEPGEGGHTHGGQSHAALGDHHHHDHAEPADHAHGAALAGTGDEHRHSACRCDAGTLRSPVPGPGLRPDHALVAAPDAVAWLEPAPAAPSGPDCTRPEERPPPALLKRYCRLLI